jgi:asparagine synthase (glutamine-hydrolysing)
MTPKYLLRRAATGLVPADVIEKRKRGFFRGASDGWLRAQMEGLVADYLLAPNARSAAFLDRAVVERMARDHATGADTSHVHLLLALLMLEVWLTSYVDRAVGRSATEPILV